MLSDIPEGVLGETIPNFHNMEFRLQQFHEAVAADPVGRVAEVKELIEEIEKRALCVGQGFGERRELTVQIVEGRSETSEQLALYQGTTLETGARLSR